MLEPYIKNVLKRCFKPKETRPPGKVIKRARRLCALSRYTNRLTPVTWSQRKVMETSKFKRLDRLDQLGPLKYLFPGFSYSVLTHTWNAYKSFVNWVHDLGKKIVEMGISSLDFEIIGFSILVHDFWKSPLSPVTEILQTKSHEQLLEDDKEVEKIAEEEGLPWKSIIDTVNGRGKFGVFLEGELSFDKTYISDEQALSVLLDFREGLDSIWFGPKQWRELWKRCFYMNEGDCGSITLNGSSEATRLFFSFKKAELQLYESFRETHNVVIEGLLRNLLEGAIETGELKVKTFNDAWTTDHDLERNLNALEDPYFRNLWLKLRSGKIDGYTMVNLPPHVGLAIVKELMRARELDYTKKREYINGTYRNLRRRIEYEIAKEANTPESRDFAIVHDVRRKPFFSLTYDPKHWSYGVKILRNSLPQDAGSIHDMTGVTVNELRLRSQRPFVALVHPLKYTKRIRELNWEDASSSFVRV